MNKDLLNVAGLIAFILGILCCITIVGVIIGVPMIIGGNKLREMSKMSDEELIKNKETLLIWTIVLLLICTISGVIALIVYLSIDNPELFKTKTSNSKKYSDIEKLNQLYKEKAITKEEFEAEKERILNKN